MLEKLSTLPTSLLVMEARRLELQLLRGDSSAMDTELYCFIQIELGSRLARDMVLDPRD